ncbi:MAG: NAD-dependent epimerase/dehydratase family protein [Bacteroidales bacterium]|nr:NAD-dependent epimerase/dehydratase family protein [Bacteroidales bacterium]
MIFVSGGSGMLGSYLLLELIKQGHVVKATRRSTTNLSMTQYIFRQLESNGDELFKKIQWVNLDLNCQMEIEEQLADIEEIYHCATEINYAPKDASSYIQRNVNITKNLSQAAINMNVKRFLHVSSIAALGVSDNDELIDEKTTWDENTEASSYSVSKYLSEMEVWRAIEEGLNAVIINPSVILGIGDWKKGSPNIFEKINRGLKFYTKGQTGFVSAKEVAQSAIALMKIPEAFGEQFVINRENLDYRTFFNLVAKNLNAKAPSIYANPIYTQLAWRFEKLKSIIIGIDPLITKQSAQTAHKKLAYSNLKVSKLINNSFPSIKQTVIEIAKIYKANK